MKITVAITGASGIPYAIRLIQELLKTSCQVDLIISQAGLVTFNYEMDFNLSANPAKIKAELINRLELTNSNNLQVYSNQDWFSPSASGSSVAGGMVICPCSMASLAKVAQGIGDDLISRSADVVIKEQKKLIIVPRETPFSAIHLENMLKLAKLNVVVLPPLPAFYTKPQTIADLIDFTISRILDQLAIKNTLTKRWG